MTWFSNAGLGLFVHWGHYAAAGWEASWPLVGGIFSLPKGQQLNVDEYHANASRFCPKENAPNEWVAAAAAAGARYAIMTTRHHDGFSMWPSETSEYNISLGGYAGDPVGEFVEACRTNNMKIGFYYSLPDWHHPDYPAFREDNKPYEFGRYPSASPEQWQRYMNYVRDQITELLSRYGTIDILWFDGAWEHSESDWQTEDLANLIHGLQPDILINDRLPGQGNYSTPEQFIPPTPPEGLWETCLTMNESWGYNPSDTNYKSATSLLHTLCEVAGRGGNLLLNVSPDGSGNLPPAQSSVWKVFADWITHSGESIFDTIPALEPWQFYGPSTCRDNLLYAHLLMHPVEAVTLRGIPINHVKSVRALSTGATLNFRTHMAILDMISGGDPLGDLVIDVPKKCFDPHVTTLKIEFDQPVKID